jgi:CheY-like chemotaxis protein
VLSSARKATILVVEDDRTLRQIYRAALTVAGYAVVAVEDGIDALKCVEQAPPGMIVLDLALPRLSGHDVRRELASRAETRHLPILVVTGTDTRNLHLADFYDVLTKPVDADTLVAAVDRGLRIADQSRPMQAMADPDVSNLRSPRMETSNRARRQARMILVVDDEVAVQKLLRHVLEEKGYTVKTAGSVGEAIFVLELGSIDAVVLDVRMPRRSGLELLEFMRLDQRLHDVPVLILTGATLTPNEEALIARDHGYVFYKSENLETLAYHLDRLTG